MKKFLVVLLALLMVFGLVGCNKKEEGGKEEGTELEDTLVVYTAANEEILQIVEPAVEEALGIDVQFISMASAEAFAKAQAERDDPQCDVCASTAEIHSDPDLFQPYKSIHADEYDPAIRDETYLSNVCNGNASVIIYNKKLCEGITIDGYESLLDPRLKGHIAMGDASKSNSAYYHFENMLLDMSSNPDDPDAMVNDAQGWEFCKKFYEQLDGMIISSSSAVYKGVASGEYWVGLTYDVGAATIINDLRGTADEGNVVCVGMKEGVVNKTGGPGIVKNCKHPNAAKAYIDWLTSKEAQELYVSVPGQQSARTDIEIPAVNYVGQDTWTFRKCPSTWSSDHRAEIVEKYSAMLAEMNFGA